MAAEVAQGIEQKLVELKQKSAEKRACFKQRLRNLLQFSRSSLDHLMTLTKIKENYIFCNLKVNLPLRYHREQVCGKFSLPECSRHLVPW